MSSKTRYADTPLGRLGFTRDGDAVWVHSKTANLGGWTIDRFGGSLNAAGIRLWVAFVTGEGGA